ncbi:MAG: hypothetical protein VB085_13485 [Peptococcaceae bacterium]|nr:hypothetical protein [Peptococcaceae bacterium]
MSVKNGIRQVVVDLLRQKYPYLLKPSIVLARVTAANLLDEARPLGRYTVRILSSNGQPDPAWPEYPAILTELDLAKGDTVVLGLARGEDAVILGRYNS